MTAHVPHQASPAGRRYEVAAGGLLIAAVVTLIIGAVLSPTLGVLARLAVPAAIWLGLTGFLSLSARASGSGRFAWATLVRVVISAAAIVALGFVGVVLVTDAEVAVGWSVELRMLVGDALRVMLVALAVMAGAIAVWRRAWPEYVLWVILALSIAAILLGAYAAADSRFAHAASAVPEPRLAVAIKRAVLLGHVPKEGSTASVVIVVPKINDKGQVTGQESHHVLAQLKTVGIPSPSGMITIEAEFSRGEDDAKVAEVLALLSTSDRVVYVSDAAP